MCEKWVKKWADAEARIRVLRVSQTVYGNMRWQTWLPVAPGSFPGASPWGSLLQVTSRQDSIFAVDPQGLTLCLIDLDLRRHAGSPPPPTVTSNGLCEEEEGVVRWIVSPDLSGALLGAVAWAPLAVPSRKTITDGLRRIEDRDKVCPHPLLTGECLRWLWIVVWPGRGGLAYINCSVWHM